MVDSYQPAPAPSVPATAQSASGGWLFMAVMGVALMILGMACIGSAYIATEMAILTFGIFLLVGAVFHVVFGIRTRRGGGFFIHLLAGILYFIAGLFMLQDPVGVAVAVTLLIAAFLFVGGIVRIVLALTEHFPHWGWVLLNGVVSVLLGGAIWRHWPWSGLWVIGLFVGIEMLFSGLSWLMLAMAFRANRTPAYGR
jgi:uncharacterized membrane protein HdeD (DUF308 family)